MNTVRPLSSRLLPSGLAALLLVGCASAYRPRVEAGSIELPAGGIAGQSAPYLLRGSYTLKELETGATTFVHVDSGSDWIPVRRSLPAGHYSVSLNPGFEIAWLTRPRPLEGSEPVLAADGPKLVVIHPGRLATVRLRSIPPREALAQR